LVINSIDVSARKLATSGSPFLVELKRAGEQTETRILVVSRDEVDIRSELAPSESLDGALPPETGTTAELRITTDDVRNDITLSTRSVANKHLPNKPEELRHDLAAQLADKCQGMFPVGQLAERRALAQSEQQEVGAGCADDAVGPRTGVQA
jgi:hypothetical protein